VSNKLKTTGNETVVAYMTYCFEIYLEG